ncbi:hypothetical protein [Compostibacter hankyongensis]|uniref:Uncharacterized protein n=1 Tax=Compostibacter hankyongensis TaxID=1007089 RepID=A0ABP8FG22_9BACT
MARQDKHPEKPEKQQKEKKKEEEDFPGYPPYPPEEDILTPRHAGRKVKVDDSEEAPSEKVPELSQSKEDNTEEMPDVPGADLDDADESIGEEDEENNYYSLGGDRHEDLEDDRND